MSSYANWMPDVKSAKSVEFGDIEDYFVDEDEIARKRDAWDSSTAAWDTAIADAISAAMACNVEGCRGYLAEADAVEQPWGATPSTDRVRAAIGLPDPLDGDAIEDAVNRWHVPPACQGQMVEVAYGGDRAGTLYRRTKNRGDLSVRYERADASSCGCEEECDCWQPWNNEPLGYDWESY